MKNLYPLLALLFIAVAPFRFAYVTWRDLTRPEDNPEWFNNPAIYLPLAAVMLLFMAWTWRYGRRVQRRQEELERLKAKNRRMEGR